MTPPSGSTAAEAIRELAIPAQAYDPIEGVANSVRVKRVALGGDRKSGMEQFALGFFVVVPFLGLLAAIPVFWGWGLGWHDIVIAVVMYAIAGHGITIGYHRLFTHKSFKASRPLKIALAF